jgi:hypothetical protein
MGKTGKCRKVRGQDEALELLAEWERSDEPASEWCRTRGINRRSFVEYKSLGVE